MLASKGRIFASSLEQNSENLYRMVFDATDAKKVDNFNECWKILEEKSSTAKAASDEKVTSYLSSGQDKAQRMSLSLARFIQNKFDCSGICETSLFYWGRSIQKGTPLNGETCLNYLKEEIANNLTYMGIVSVIVSLVMLILFFAQYALWKNYDD